MSKLIQPLSDLLKQYPDISAGAIAIISFILTLLAGFCVFLFQQKIDLEKSRFNSCEDSRKEMLGQIDKAKEIIQKNTESALKFEEINELVKELERQNLDLKSREKLDELQNNMNQMISTFKGDLEYINKAISTQEDRRNIFRKSGQKQTKKFSIDSIKSLFRRNK